MEPNLYTLGMDLYIVYQDKIYIHLFGNWMQSSCFNSEKDLLDRSASPHENDFITNNFMVRV